MLRWEEVVEVPRERGFFPAVDHNANSA